MSIAEDTIASLSLQLRACESLLDDERKAHERTRTGLYAMCAMVTQHTWPRGWRARLVASARSLLAGPLLSAPPTVALDDDGYPTEATEKTVAAWPFGEFRELMGYVKQAWKYADWGWSEEDAVDDDGAKIRRFHISTAGWSGNETLIGSMRDNFIFWSTCWVQANRGGHYVFEIRS